MSETADDVRLARDDRAAGFAALYSRLAPSVLAWARLRIPSVMRGTIDPEDVVQEVWRRAFERFESFDPARSPFRAWVFRIANLVLMEGLRRVRTRGLGGASTPDGDDPAAAACDPATTVSRAVAADEALAGFIAAALREEDDDRRLFAYRLEGLTFEECAERLGVNAAAARKRWQRLRERLAELARRTGLADDDV